VEIDQRKLFYQYNGSEGKMIEVLKGYQINDLSPDGEYHARNGQDSEMIVDLGDSWIHDLHLLMGLLGYDQMTDCGGDEMVTAVLE
jgi:hypothetical protein